MNNLKKAGALAFALIFTFSMVIVPFMPTHQVQPVANPNVPTPEEVLYDIQKYVDIQKEDGPLGAVLASYRDSGYIPNTVSRNDAGEIGAVVTVRTDSDVASLDEIMSVNWKVEVGAMTLAYGHIPSPEAAAALENFDGIVTAFADALYREKTTGVEPRPVAEPPLDNPEYAVVPHIGGNVGGGVGAYDGAGVTVGVVDTGVDFSHAGLVGTMDIGSDGLPTSYDPTGYGFVVSLYRANSTVVDPDAYLAFSSWNVLSYEMGGNWYINWSTCQHGDPYVNNQGGLSHLDWFIDAYLAAWWGDAYTNQDNLTDYYYNVMRQDFQIPDPSLSQAGPQLNITLNATAGTFQMVPYYTAGYAFQQRWDPYVKVFAPVLVLDGDTIIVDWNTTRAHTEFWNHNINYGVWDFNDTASWDYFNAMGDWSFVDDYNDGYMYMADGTEAHLNMYFDYTDGERFGLGTLAHCYEGNIFGLGMIDGIGLSGRALGIMYDGDSHGTFVSGQIAGQPMVYDIGVNGTSETISGIAPGAKIMGIMSVGIAAEFNSMLWAAGFDINYTSGYWEWNGASAHQAHITSNSWGWVTPQYYELWGQYSLIYAATATPGFFNATHYPGMVQCFSAGNSGPGYGTTTPPRAPQIINVGASTSYHTFENAYGPNQGFDQIADFSSRGPLTLGYPKPDVLAPGRNNYGFVPYYGSTFLTPVLGVRNQYAVYAGTSMACPLAAGLAAVMLEADPTLAPDEVKYIMQSTASDIGMDGLAQGHGVIDAAAAIDFIDAGTGYTFYTYDSVANWGTATAEAWAADMDPYMVDVLINNTAIPGMYADGNIYFGVVAPGATPTVTVTGDNWVAADQTMTAMHYVVDTVTTFPFETYVFNETTELGIDNLRGGWMELDTELGGAYANFAAAPYATISITGDQDTFDDDSMWAFVFDWADVDPANGRIDYYNETLDIGDELTRWQYAGGTGNVLKIDLSHPMGLGSLFPNTPAILVHDANIMGQHLWNQTGDGNALEVTVTTWQLVADGNIGFAANGDDIDVTLTAPMEYGVHQGFVMFNSTYMMPYSYMVYATYDDSGTVLELAEGVGAVQTPYEHGAVTAGWDSYYTARSADHMSFVVDLANSSVDYLAARINWTNADTDMDVAIVDMTGFERAHSGDAVKSTTDSSLAIADLSAMADPTGMYIIYTSLNAMDGADIPEFFTLTVVGLETLAEPSLELTWTSRDSPTPTVVTTGGSAVGDHVEMTATWTDGVNPGMPEFGITTVEMKILYGTLFYAEGDLVHASDPGGAFDGIINPDDFAWETVPGITEGDNVRISCDFDSSDVDVMAWWSDTPMGERTYANNLVDMASSDHPETDSFTATRSGDLDFGILDYANDGGLYYLTVDTRLGLEPARADGNTFTIDTYFLLANQTYSVLVDSDTGTNLRYIQEVPNIFIGNFFAPDVTVNAPEDMGMNVHNITWSVTDLNADDVHYYSVWLSADGGVSYQVLARNLTATEYHWDSSGFLEKDDYIIRVRAYSLDFSDPPGLALVDDEANYWPGDFGDGFSPEFSAGDVPPPTTPTTTEPTTPTEPTEPPAPPVFDPLLIGLIGGIGVGVVVLLILFLIRKK